MSTVRLLTSDNQEKLNDLNERASDQLEKEHGLVISHDMTIGTIAGVFMDQLLKEANGYQLLISKDKDGTLKIRTEAPQLSGYDNIIDLKPVSK